MSEAPSCGPTFMDARSARLGRAETAARAARQITHHLSSGGPDVPPHEMQHLGNEATNLDLISLREAS